MGQIKKDGILHNIVMVILCVPPSMQAITKKFTRMVIHADIITSMAT